MGDVASHSKIYVIFRPDGTHGEADIKMRCPVDEPVMIVSVGSGSYGPDGQYVVIDYGPDNRPPEVIANDVRAVQQREREIRESRERSPFRGLSSTARAVLVEAQMEARRHGQDVIEPEQLLAAIARVSPETVKRGSAMPPDWQEERWLVSVRFAIEAATEADAHVILDQALTRLAEPMPLRAGPVIEPAMRDDIWVAQLYPEPARGYSPDTAENRCRWASHFFGPGPTWVPCESKLGIRWDWPPNLFGRMPGDDDTLLHPAVLAVQIWCEARTGEE